MAFLFGGSSTRDQVSFFKRAVYSVSMAARHSGLERACLTVAGSVTATRTRGLRLPVLDLVSIGWVLVTGGGEGGSGEVSGELSSELFGLDPDVKESAGDVGSLFGEGEVSGDET